jgi:hypothetical protein
LKPASVASFAANGLWTATAIAGLPTSGFARSASLVFQAAPSFLQLGMQRGMIATAVRAAAMTPMIRMIGDVTECDWRQSRSTLFAQRQNP